MSVLETALGRWRFYLFKSFGSVNHGLQKGFFVAFGVCRKFFGELWETTEISDYPCPIGWHSIRVVFQMPDQPSAGDANIL